MNGGMGANSWLNNPFLYLIFLAMFGGNGFGWGGNRGAMQTEQFDSLRNQIADNQNNQLAMDAIKGMPLPSISLPPTWVAASTHCNRQYVRLSRLSRVSAVRLASLLNE